MRSFLVLVTATSIACGGPPSSAPGVSTPEPAPGPGLRLPDTVAPTRYTVTLDVDPASERFGGAVDIDVELTAATQTIWLNATAITVDEAAVEVAGQRSAALVTRANEDVIGLRLEAPVGPGSARLTLRYRGEVTRKNGDGVFAEREGDDWYVFTQFEPLDARRAFPCFDEPHWKVPWQLTLRVPPGQRALSNTPIAQERDEAGRRVVEFAETKPLPSYLIAFAVGPFDVVDAGVSRAGVPIRIVTQRGRGDEARYAAEVTPQVLGLLEDYTGIPYPYEKLDTITIPSTQGFGAMEHPGLVTFASSIVLWTPAQDSFERRRRFAAVQAHELAHQWFGNLVTMQWWDDIWLNEAFASWAEVHVLEPWQPDWETLVEGVTSRLGAMRADALASARRIREPITSDDDVENAFDSITYAKGEAVLQMFETWLGQRTFRTGIQAYLRAHAYGNATADDFAAAMSEAAGRDLRAPLASFLEQTGVPMVEMALACDDGPPRLSLKQRRFSPLGADVQARTWLLPVCVRYGTAEASARACALMDQAEAELPLADLAACPTWLAPNADGVGYYHAALAPGLRDTVLATAADRLSAAERAALLGDLAALARAGRVPVTTALQAAARAANDPSRAVVEQAIEVIEQVERLVADGQREQFAAYVREAFSPRARSLGVTPVAGESETARRLRPALVRVVGAIGRDASTGAAAEAASRTWLADRTALSGELVQPLLEVAAARDDVALVTAMREAVLATQDRRDRTALLRALGKSSDRAALDAALGLSLDDRIDARIAADAMWSAAGSPDGREAAWDFVSANLDQLKARLSEAQLSRLALVATGFCTRERRDEVAARLGPLADQVTGGARQLRQALEAIEQCAAVRSAQAADLASFLAAHGRG